MGDAQQPAIASSAAIKAAEAAENAMIKVLKDEKSFNVPGVIDSVARLLANCAVNTATHMDGQKTESDLSYAMGCLDMVYKVAKGKVNDRLGAAI